MVRRCREPGSFFQRPDTPKVLGLWQLAGWLVGPCSNRYLAVGPRLDWPARSATRSMLGDFLTNGPGLSAVNDLPSSLSSWACLLVFFFDLFFYCRFADSGPLVLEGPPSGYLIPEARLVSRESLLTVSLPQPCGLSRAVDSRLALGLWDNSICFHFSFFIFIFFQLGKNRNSPQTRRPSDC